jgi:hypothetical protein
MSRRIGASREVATLMFLVARSVFWLTVAYLVIRPGGDLPGTAAAMSEQALAAGQQIVAEQILSNDCNDDLRCLGGQAVVAAVLSAKPSADLPMQDSPQVLAPVPQPRPDWLG